jgi:hypothetical protein
MNLNVVAGAAILGVVVLRPIVGENGTFYICVSILGRDLEGVLEGYRCWVGLGCVGWFGLYLNLRDILPLLSLLRVFFGVL